MRSIWSDEMPRIRPEKKTLPQSAEVLIIGGGMAGLLCAYLLKESGIRAIILEAEEICSGQTRNTTAKITSQHG
ncbi:MAG: FAD-binding oxidoreductase, partial [Clostridia bacterium]|nr:FAD-binding oxidoreductase [Clostridia bacterium]